MRVWRRVCLLAVVVMCAAAASPAHAQTTHTGALTGTWSGYIIGQPGSGVTRRHIVVVVNAAQTGGSWKLSATCHGPLRLDSISNGYHHYLRGRARGSRCAGGDIDCLKRVGAAVYDAVTSHRGGEYDASGTLRRVRSHPAAAPAPTLAPAVSAPPAFQSRIQPLSGPARSEVKRTAWHPGCPVPLSGLRVLTVSYLGFDGVTHAGALVVNQSAAAPLARVFRRLYRMHFPIRHMALADMYGPARSRPADGDVSGAFDCRQAVPSPCVGGTGTGSWSEHAYGEAVDLDPVENPYVGCGQTRDPKSRPFFNRSRHRPGMVTTAVVEAFGSIGWGWGGSWTGSTKDYMHFSASGH